MKRNTATRRPPATSSHAADVSTPGTRQRWTRFLVGVLMIFLFAFGVIPRVQRLGPVRDVHEAIQKSGIDATALFYSESEVSSEAEASIRNALRYAPRRAD